MKILNLSPIYRQSTWILPLLCQFFAAFIAGPAMAQAQAMSAHSFCGTYAALPPDVRHSDSLVYDRFGNTFAFADLALPKRISRSGSDYNDSGYFYLTFLGNPPTQARPVITQVFTDLSNLIRQRKAANNCSPLPAEMVELEVIWLNFSDPVMVQQFGLLSLPAGAGAIGTPFYSGPHDPYCQEVAVDRPFIKINGGQAMAGIVDGRILLNSNYAWNYDPSLPSGGFTGLVDLYSAVLHEGMHVLGYASRMGFNDAYSLWDQTLRVVNNYQPNGGGGNPQPVLVNPSAGASNCWQAMPNFINIALYSCSEVQPGFDVVVGDAAIAPVGGNPTLANQSAINNMLSHLRPSCSGQNVDYVMQPGLGLNQARRVMTDPEQQILCALGYQLSSPTVACDGCYAIGNADYTLDLNASCCPKVYYSCVGGSIHISSQDLLCNDVANSDLKIIRLRQFSFNPNIQITPSGDGWDVRLLTPQFGSFFLSVLYTVQGCADARRMHNQYAEFLWFTDDCQPCISADPCTNLLCVQDFENFNANQTTVNSHHVWFGRPFGWEGDDNIGTPDIIHANNGNNYLHLYNTLHNDQPNTSSTGRESVTLELQDCIEPGCDLHLALDVSRVLGTGAAALEIWGSNVPPCAILANPIVAIPNHCGVQTACSPGIVFDPICVTTIPANSTGNFGVPNLQPAFPNAPFVWPNNTAQAVCFLTLVPSGAPDVGIGIDNLTAIRVCTPTITAQCKTPSTACAGGIMNMALRLCAPTVPGGGTTLISPAVGLPPGWKLVGDSLAPFLLGAGKCVTLSVQFIVPSDATIGSMPDLVLHGKAAGVCSEAEWACSEKVRVVNCIGPGSGRSPEQNRVSYKTSLLPNPASDRVTVQVQGAAPDAVLRIQIMGVNGAVVQETTVGNGQVLPIDCWPGLYFCRVDVDDGLVEVVKLIVVP